jgi:hypothetical protein
VPGNSCVREGLLAPNCKDNTMRYVVQAKKRRAASSSIYKEVFSRVQQAKDIQIASETMDLTVQPAKAA